MYWPSTLHPLAVCCLCLCHTYYNITICTSISDEAPSLSIFIANQVVIHQSLRVKYSSSTYCIQLLIENIRQFCSISSSIRFAAKKHRTERWHFEWFNAHKANKLVVIIIIFFLFVVVVVYRKFASFAYIFWPKLCACFVLPAQTNVAVVSVWWCWCCCCDPSNCSPNWALQRLQQIVHLRGKQCEQEQDERAATVESEVDAHNAGQVQFWFGSGWLLLLLLLVVRRRRMLDCASLLECSEMRGPQREWHREWGREMVLSLALFKFTVTVLRLLQQTMKAHKERQQQRFILGHCKRLIEQ